MTTFKRISYVMALCLTFMACKKNDGPNPFDDVVETDLPVNTPVTVKVNNAIGGYYVAQPALYAKTSKSYPTIVFVHGAGQYGNGGSELPLLLQDGIEKVINEKRFPASFHVNDKDYSFIVLAPHFSRYPSAEEIITFIEFAKKKYRIDKSRLYLSGLSMGGFVSTDVASHYPTVPAAIVPISGVLTDVPSSMNIAKGNIPVWTFHNTNDPMINPETATIFVNQVNSYHPAVPAKLTWFQSSEHDAWTRALDPLFKENNMNIYEWMLQYKK